MKLINFCINYQPAKQKSLQRTKLKKQVLHQQLLVKSLIKIIICLLILYNENFFTYTAKININNCIFASVKPKRKFM